MFLHCASYALLLYILILTYTHAYTQGLAVAVFCLLYLRPELVAALLCCCVMSTDAYLLHGMLDCLTETASACYLADVELCFSQCMHAWVVLCSVHQHPT